MSNMYRCGISGFSPKVIQKCANMKIFCFCCSIASLASSTLYVYVSSQITTLEKQFGFTSSQSGFLISAFDIGYLSFVLFLSFFAERIHIPRALTFSCTLFGFSAVLCSVAYFAFPLKYDSSVIGNLTETSFSLSGKTCDKLNTSHSFPNESMLSQCDKGLADSTSAGMSTAFTTVAMAIIATGMILQGIAKSPMEPYIICYIDNNVPQSSTAAYIVITACTMIGPAMGYGLGGLFSQMHVSFKDVDMSQTHPQWIGAWWFGFIVFGIFAIVSGLPLMFFPQKLVRRTNQHADEDNEHPRVTFIGYFKEFYLVVKSLLENKIFMILNISGIFELLSISGMVAFTPKYLETQFGQQTWISNILTGVLTVVPISVGTLVGGFITSKRKFSPITCIKFLIVVSFMDVVFNLFGMILGCPTPDIVGYDINENKTSTQCMIDCHCSGNYFPVCGADGRNYFSPCHAGCTGTIEQTYTQCSCLVSGDTATPGVCSTNCKHLIPYLVTTLIFKLVVSLSHIPIFILLIRSVPSKDKGITVGFSSFFVTLLGWFPGAILFGRIIDSACLSWSSSCEFTGACALYDNNKVRMSIYGVSASLHVIATGLKIVQLFIARRKTDWTVDNEEPNEKETNRNKIKEEEALLQELPSTIINKRGRASLSGISIDN